MLTGYAAVSATTPVGSNPTWKVDDVEDNPLNAI